LGFHDRASSSNKHQITSTKTQTRTKREEDKHQITSTKIQTRTKRRNSGNSKPRARSSNSGMAEDFFVWCIEVSAPSWFPRLVPSLLMDSLFLFSVSRLGFVVLLLGSCLLFGACDLELYSPAWCL
jgi:hypothetical protein